ncbi:putative RNA-binding protein with PIN domain [Murinocardiopsis flavida]|uniref:Putative RNA-binding protein with PIN domain n=1 Tax=Murinocardiopsis flavida TaxID=645275 RepID=A0A2P8D032_9ACTN|nr:NYN domain-containing protein [Murinocardiopsis flavida]PSK90564.1 putative RNA-binding protein with PIN domain [Murinocardiopsis flavida]
MTSSEDASTGPAGGPGPSGASSGSGAPPEPLDAPEPDTGDTGDEEGLDRPLPEDVRARVVEYGADILGGLPAAEVPAALRRVAKFEPRRRARLAGPQIAAQLETDAGFRGRVAERVARVWPELAEGLRRGMVPPAADPVAVAAAAYLLRPAGWALIVDRIHGDLEQQESAKEVGAVAAELAEARRRLDEVKSEHHRETVRLRSGLREQRSEIADLRRRLHAERQRAKDAVERAERASADAAERDTAAAGRLGAVEAENRRLRNRLAAAESQVENARRAARAGRSADDARLHVLLDVLMDASHGLRRELALPTSIESPADLVAEEHERRVRGTPSVGLAADDPAVVDQLLLLPRVHLLVDGYNVTKTGYGTLPLADQRTRLLTSLEGLASRTKAEITCVFDGADVDAPPALPSNRRVRLLFSDPGETADELIIRLVRAEPPGRPLGVVTSDREIVSAVRREGARPVPSLLFLRRLEGA